MLNLVFVYLTKSVPPFTFPWREVTCPDVAMTYSKAVQYEPVSWQAQLWPFPEQKLQSFPAVRVKFRNMSRRPFAIKFIHWWSPCLSCLKVSALITFNCFLCSLSRSHLSSYHVFPSPFSLHPCHIIPSTCKATSMNSQSPQCWSSLEYSDPEHTFPGPVPSPKYCIYLF